MAKSSEKEEPIELDLPDGTSEARQAVEVIRAWIADGGLLVSINSDAFGERLNEWGRLLAQIGHHVARSASLRGEMKEHEALAAIKEGFDAMHPTHEPAMSGNLRGRITH